MRFTCNVNEFGNAFSVATKAVDSKSALEELCSVKVESTPRGTLKFTGYDLKNSVSTEIKANIIEEGGVLLSSKRFGAYIAKLPDGEFEVDVDENYNVTLKSLSSKTKLSTKGLSIEKYPNVEAFDSVTSFSMPYAKLKEMIDGVSFCASKDDSRVILSGCNISYSDNCLNVVAIDGFRLALRTLHIDNLPDFSITVPIKAISELSRNYEVEEDIVINIGEKMVKFSTEVVTITSRLIQGEFVNYKNLFNQSMVFDFKLSVADMYAAADRALLLVNNESKKVAMACDFKPDEVSISSQTSEGNISDEIDVSEFRGNGCTVTYNSVYIRDMLKNIPDEECHWKCAGANGPTIVTPCEGDSYTYLVLPVRVS